jgi:hypothetical protein
MLQKENATNSKTLTKKNMLQIENAKIAKCYKKNLLKIEHATKRKC